MTHAIRPARPDDVALLLQLIRGLADYERLLDRVVATEATLRDELFGPRPVVEAVIAWGDQDAGGGAQALGFAAYFHNFSTFVGRRGLYLEDLYVVPAARGRGLGKALIRHVGRIAAGRGCGRFEWSVLDWNQPAIDFYRALGAEVLPDWRICRVQGEALQRFAAD